VLAAVDLGDADPSAYGVLDAHDDGRPGLAVRRVVEKPRAGEAPSRLASVGRYLYTPELFDALEESWARRPDNATGEFWPMEAMHALAGRDRLRACLVGAPRWDTGTPSGYLRAVVDHALADARLGEEFGGWLRDRVRRL
jgi:UTP--glucose-1-phosphate uridylyltransferase